MCCSVLSCHTSRLRVISHNTWCHTIYDIYVKVCVCCNVLQRVVMSRVTVYVSCHTIQHVTQYVTYMWKSVCVAMCCSVLSWHTMYDRFLWKCYILEIHQIEKLKFLGTNSNETKISICIFTAKYHEIWVSWSGGIRECRFFSGNFHICVWVMSRIRMSHVTRTYKLYHTYEFDTTQLWPVLFKYDSLSAVRYVSALCAAMGWLWLVGPIKV